MKKFLYKLFGFALLLVLAVSIILKIFGGYADYFYVKFTTPQAKSMIIGDSRSFQGMQPAVINENLSGFQKPLFNYSFTTAQVSYGESYLKSIKAKLDLNTKNGLFILSVHPFSLAQRDSDNFAKGIYFEADEPPHNMRFPSMDPNPEYFFKNFKYFHFKTIFSKVALLHEDGWLELNNIPTDSAAIKAVQVEVEKTYHGFAERWKKAPYRVSKLEETIAFLKQHGTVILVRMPVSKSVLKIESGFWPNFDDEIEKIAAKENVDYINYAKSAHSFVVFDGSHLDNKSGAIFSKAMCDSIRMKSLLPKINK